MHHTTARRTVLQQAAAHHGIFTWDDWLRAGLTADELRHEVARGSVVRVHPTAYRVTGAPATWRSRLLAAVRSAGPHALASHRAASSLWTLTGSPRDALELTAPRHRRARLAGIRTHESVDLPSRDHYVIDGIPVTNTERTLLDAGRWAGAVRLGDFVDDAVRRKLTGYGELAAWLEDIARPGLRGVRRLRSVLATRPGGTIPPGSVFERQVLDLIDEFGLPPPTRQIPVETPEGRFLIDMGWPFAMVGVECDGNEFHTLESQSDHDKWRQNLIQLSGWLLLRYTPARIRHRRAATAQEIRTALAARGHPPALLRH